MQDRGYWSSTVPAYDEVSQNPYWWLLDFIWNIIYRIWIEDEESEYHYTKVTKASINGEEEKTYVQQNGQSVGLYNPRTLMKHVRAVRIMP